RLPGGVRVRPGQPGLGHPAGGRLRRGLRRTRRVPGAVPPGTSVVPGPGAALRSPAATGLAGAGHLVRAAVGVLGRLRGLGGRERRVPGARPRFCRRDGDRRVDRARRCAGGPAPATLPRVVTTRSMVVVTIVLVNTPRGP